MANYRKIQDVHQLLINFFLTVKDTTKMGNFLMKLKSLAAKVRAKLVRLVFSDGTSYKTLGLSADLYDYVKSVSLREPDILAQLRLETSKLPMAGMQIAPDQGQLIALLAQLTGARKTLEVGVFTGYSTLVTALALPDDGKIVACDIDEDFTNIARRYWEQAGVAHKIDLRIAPALETLDQLLAQGETNSFDFVFIDADKNNYDRYYERSLQLVRPGGLIVIDNTLWGGSVIDLAVTDDFTEAIRALNKKLHWDKRISLSMVPIADGLTLALKRS